MMALNVVWQMAAGERFDFNENGMVQLLNFMQSINGSNHLFLINFWFIYSIYIRDLSENIFIIIF